MAETAVKLNQREAARLFERGVAAARGGHRCMAVVLLSRAVQFDPRHEHAWLWLSGVLEEPSEIAFCLRSVLSINPHNERAHQGLAWLEQRNLIAHQPAAQLVADFEAHTDHVDEHQKRESWWISWRQSRRELNRAWMLVWATCIFLMLGILTLNWALRDAIVQNVELARATATKAEYIAMMEHAVTPVPILQTEVSGVHDARVLAYLSAIEEPRKQLQAAVQTYREIANQPGSSVLMHAAATRKLRDQVAAGRDVIARVTPPPTLAQAHASYLEGLKQELTGLDEILQFYGNLDIPLANRAILRFEDADRQLATARLAFLQNQTQSTESHKVLAQTIR